MRRILLVVGFVFCLGTVHAESMLRISCEDANLNAEVYVNGVFRGECPLDIKVQAGAVGIKVSKSDSPGKERVFEQTLRLGDDIVKKITVVLGAPQLTAEALAQEQARQQAETAKRIAEEARFKAEEAQRKEEEARLKVEDELRRAEVEGAVIAEIAQLMVSIPGKKYALGKYEVTQKQWWAIMGNRPSYFTNCGDTCPVENVSWNDVQDFIQKLNAKTGLTYRLPSETEWEFACYGGKGGLFSMSNYCGGENLDSLGWYDGNSGNVTHPVGLKQPNGYGIYDMSGNVWEWMENKYDNEHDNEHDWRAVRGGSWYVGSQYVRVAYRRADVTAYRDSNLGFRLARTLQ